MNFSFRIIRLSTTNKRCQFYTILKDGEDLNEANKFLHNKRNKESPDFQRLRTRIKYIKDRHGARISYFKPEGTQQDLVFALHAGAKKSGYLRINHLRWYCIRLSERCVIFGNGGVKTTRTTQDDAHLIEKETDMRWIDKVIELAQNKGDLVENDNGHLTGNLEFTSKRLEEYGLQ